MKKISGDREPDINSLGSERNFQTGYIYLYERLMIYCTVTLLHSEKGQHGYAYLYSFFLQRKC